MRALERPLQGLIWLVAISWTLFQLWIVSPLPYTLGIGLVSDTQARAVHLAFALLLAFGLGASGQMLEGRQRLFGLFYLLLTGLALYHGGQLGAAHPQQALFLYGALLPLLLAAHCFFADSSLRRLLDLLLALLAAGCALYLYLFHRELSDRPGTPLLQDLAVAGFGLLLLLEASRRTMGPALMVIAGIFLIYGFAGPWMPEVISHAGASFQRAMAQHWLSNEGVFGIALGVSTSFVFLFVLFGALLNRAGAGNWFIQLAFALLGHLRGGPAKASVLASGMNGLVSGSSIANVVTTGTFTIPLMRKVGFSRERAGAIEVASSVNGQIMPPVMGAAAFLMAEYVGIAYTEVIKHAFLPAVIAYAALIYIVHLEACKEHMGGLQRPPSPQRYALLRMGLSTSGIFILLGVAWLLVSALQALLGAYAAWGIGLLLLGTYLALLAIAVRHPLPETADSDTLTQLPRPGEIALGGLYFLLPVAVLIWLLVIERLSPGLAAFWAVVLLIIITVSQPLLIALLRREGRPLAALRHGIIELFAAFNEGARGMVGIALATAAAGIIVGTVSMTGLGLVMTDLVETLSGGNLMAMLLLTAAISLILGLGLPTTANYIIVATLMAPVIVDLGAQHGLLVPLIAVHLFVFYFGLLADVTPPVGLASYAAAAVSGGDPIRTGLHAIRYNLRTIVLPFLFLFNTQLLLIGIASIWHGVMVFLAALAGMLLFAAATQGWMLTRNRLWESALLLLVAFTLFRPDWWMNQFSPEFDHHPASQLIALAEVAPVDGQLRLVASGMDWDGEPIQRTLMLPMGPADSGEQRLQQAGLMVMMLGDEPSITGITHNSPAQRAGLDFGWQIETVLVPAERPAPEWFWLPALLLATLVWLGQRRRLKSD